MPTSSLILRFYRSKNTLVIVMRTLAHTLCKDAKTDWPEHPLLINLPTLKFFLAFSKSQTNLMLGCQFCIWTSSRCLGAEEAHGAADPFKDLTQPFGE